MNALNHPDAFSEDERRTHAEPGDPHHRRLRDSRFNMLKWPVFLALWAVSGAALLTALLYWAASRA